MVARPLARRTVMASAAIILAALAGVALPAAAAALPDTGTGATLSLPPPDTDKHSHDPRCHPKPDCPSDGPTTTPPTPHPTGPAPTPTGTDGAPAPGGSQPANGGAGPGASPGAPGQPGQPGQNPDVSGGAGGARPGIVPGPLVGGLLRLADRWRHAVRLFEIGSSGGLNLQADRFRMTHVAGGGWGKVRAMFDDTGSQVKEAGPTSLASAARPFWPILGGGTILIAVITAVLLISLRDKTDRLVTAEPVGSVEGLDQAVVSPRGPIKVDWVETPGNRVDLEP